MLLHHHGDVTKQQATYTYQPINQSLRSLTCTWCVLIGIYLIGRRHGVSSASDEALSLVSHAAEHRLKNILNKLAVISQHRMEVLKVRITSCEL